MARKEREFEIDDRQAEVYTGSGGRGALSLPSGLELFKPPKTGTFTIDVVAFKTTNAVDKFVPGLRFSPPNKWHYTSIFFQHGGVGPDRQTVVCAAKTFGKPCAICEARHKMGNDPHPDVQKAKKELNPRERQLFLVAFHDERAGRIEDPKLWEVSTFNFKKQLDIFLAAADADEAESFNRYWHPTKGCTIRITAQEEPSGNGQSFSKFTPVKMRPRREPLPDSFWDLTGSGAYDLYSLVKEPNYKQVHAMFHGVDADDDEDDRQPQGRTVSRTRDDDDDSEPPKRKPQPKDEDDEDKPAPKKKPTAKADDDEDAAPKKTEPKTPAAKYAEGDSVVYNDGSSMIRGEVIESIPDRRLVKVKFEGKKSLMTLDYDDEDLHEAASTKAKEQGAKQRDEDEPTPKRKKAEKPKDDDDDQPRKSSRDEDDEPAPKTKAATKSPSPWDDDEDDPKPRSRD